MKTIAVVLFLLSFALPCVSAASVIGKPINNLGLVAYWPLDEASGSVAGDASGHGQTGTISGSAPWTLGKRGGAVEFGTSLNQYIDGGAIAALDGATRATMCAYLYRVDGTWPVSVGAGNLTALKQFVVEWATDGNLYFEADTDGSQYNYVPLTGGGWHHFCFVFNGTLAGNARAVIYVDGAATSATYGNTPPAALPTNAQMGNFVIGSNINSGGSTGKIDEVRVYNRALSAAEVAALYTGGGSYIVSPAKLAALGNYSSINSGLVGYWSLDNTDVSTSVVDRSGNGNNGGFIGAATSGAKVAGKLGQALVFDGVDDYVQTPVNHAFTSGTFAAWVKLTTASPTDFASPIFNRTGGEATGISVNSSREIRYTWHNSIETWGFGTGLYVPVNEWVFMAASIDPTSATIYMYTTAGGLQSTTTVPVSGHTAITLDNLRLGTDTCCGGRYWKGPLDDLRVYDRALNRNEIQQLVNLGAGKQNTSASSLQKGSSLSSGLLGYWTFDSLDVTDKVYDKSGQGNDGYFGLGGTSTVKAAGKVGQGVNFLNKGNYVDATNNANLKLLTGGFSVSAWVYATSTATQMFVFHGRGCSHFASYWLSIGGMENQNRVSKFAFGFNTSDAGGTVQDVATTGNASTSRWVHLTGTYNGSSQLALYVDGVLQATASVAGNPYNTTDRLSLGADPGCSGRFPAGRMDDVRIYGRQLTASEVKQLYNVAR